MKVLKILLLVFHLCQSSPTQSESEKRKETNSHQRGHNFGGIFPLHEQVSGKPDSPCGAVKEEKGMQRLEAMLYALDEINNSPDILPNITLGALIIDSCSSDTYALEQSMEFVRYYMNQISERPRAEYEDVEKEKDPPEEKDVSEYRCESGKPPIYVPHKPVTSVIGASFSVVSIMVANILRLFKIPQVSYASTSTELSDKSRFEYFSRVVPPDNFQAQAMVEIVKELGWKYVSTVAVEGDYGEKGISSFITYSEEAGICIAATEKIVRNAKIEDYDRIIEKLAQKHQARAVVLFVDEDNTRKLLHATIRTNRTEHFLWIGSDSWGAKVHPVRDQEWAAEGAITILPHRNPIKGFDDYYTSLVPRMDWSACNESQETNIPLEDSDKIVNCRNGWFREFWSQHNKCSFENSSKMCTGEETISGYEQEGLVPFVIDAVYATAYAIHELIEDECGTEPFYFCDELKPAPLGVQLLKYLRNITFIGRQGTEIRFNSDGDAFGSYNIYQYQKHPDGRYDYHKIGAWKDVLTLDLTKLRWGDSNESPRSICSEPCPAGYIRNFQDQCCWVCVSCREDAFVYNDTCKSCNPGFGPNVDKTECEKLKAIVLDWVNPWILVPVVFSSCGILFALFTAAVFVYYNTTPVIMASGRELCYVLLSGIISCYSMTFVILAEPTPTTCAIMRVGTGLCLCICYSAIFTKTNRISRIFNRGVKNIKKLLYTSPTSQVFITSGIVSVQLIGGIIWCIIDPPDVKEIFPYPLSVAQTCQVSAYALIISLFYNIILIVLCTWYAFKTRKIPENFNEAKYIGFTMYSTCIIWLAFIPIYFGTNNDYMVQSVSVCMCLSLNATVCLGCLFIPKVYLVIFQPYKNVRQPNGPHLGAANKNRPTYSMKFVASKPQAVQSIASNSKATPEFEEKHVNGDPKTLPDNDTGSDSGSDSGSAIGIGEISLH